MNSCRRGVFALAAGAQIKASPARAPPRHTTDRLEVRAPEDRLEVRAPEAHRTRDDGSSRLGCRASGLRPIPAPAGRRALRHVLTLELEEIKDCGRLGADGQHRDPVNSPEPIGVSGRTERGV